MRSWPASSAWSAAALEERARDIARQSKTQAELLQAQLAGSPPVSDDELRQATAAAESAAAAAGEANADVERLSALLPQSRQWADLQSRLADAAARRARYAAVLDRAAVIEAFASRLADLRAVLPLMKRLHQHRRALADSLAHSAKLAGQLAAERAKVRGAEEGTAALQQQIAMAAAAVETARGREQELATRHLGLKHTLDLIAPYERARREREEARRKAAALGPDPAALLLRASRTLDDLTELHAAFPALRRFAGHRAALVAAIGAHARAAEAHRTRSAESAAAEAARVEATALVATADAALQAARDHTTAAKERESADRRALEAVHEADGRADCPTCGQALTDEHRREEESRRARRLEASQSARRQSEQRLAAARGESERRGKELKAAECRARRTAEGARDLARRRAGRAGPRPPRL